jgi:peptidoglycan/LPS O-acetylase OafA/YrhL
VVGVARQIEEDLVTPQAWWMLGLTWGVVTVLAGWFFWRVVTTPVRPEDDE